MGSGPAPYIYAYCREDAGAALAARMFAPAMGIKEDPATGGAAAAMAAILPDGIYEIVQGEDMGRRSEIRLQVSSGRARIGGKAVFIGEGVIKLPM